MKNKVSHSIPYRQSDSFLMYRFAHQDQLQDYDYES